MNSFEIVIAIPCYNEEKSIGEVIRQFKKELPSARVIVCDNASTDQTSQFARLAGAEILFEPNKGKGFAIKRLFRDIEADIFVVVDGDLTYHAASIRQLLQTMITEKVDLVIGTRQDVHQNTVYPPGHRWGNHFFTEFLKYLYGSTFTDVFSGYRVLSKRLVKNFPLTSKGFDIEIEMSIYVLDLGISFREVLTPYGSRLKGSYSKLNKYRDGLAILKKVFLLYKDDRPTTFFSLFSGLSFFISLILLIPVLQNYFKTGLVPRFPTLFVGIGLLMISVLTLLVGLILENLSRSKLENRLLHFLKYPSLHSYLKELTF